MSFKRTLALLMAMVMVFSLCPTTALAAETADGNWEYTVNDDGTATIDAYNGDDGTDIELVIPSELDGYPVAAIGTEAFYRCDFLSVTLPNTLTAIADDAFSRANVSAVYFDGTPEQWEALLPNIGTTGNDAILNGNLVIMRYSQLILDETKTAEIYPYGNSVSYSFTAPEDGFYCLFTAADTDPEGFWAYFETSIHGAKEATNMRIHGTVSDNKPIGDYNLAFLEAGTEATVTVSNPNSNTQQAELTLTRVQPLGAGNSAHFSLGPSCYGWYALRADQAADYTATYTATDSYYYPEVGFPINVGSYEYSNWHTGNGAKYDYLTMEEGTWLLVRLYNNHSFTLSGDLIFMPTLPVTGLSFGNDSHSGMVGKQFWPVLYTSPEGAWEDLTFIVEDESIAQVKNASGIGCCVELVGVGETTLTVTSASGASDTMTVTAWMPEVLEAGVESPVDSLSTYERRYFSFTAPEDGTYYFRMPMTQSEDGSWYYPELSNHGEASDGSWNDINSGWDYENGWYYRYYTMEKNARVVFSLFNAGYSLDLTAAVTAALTDPVTEIIPDVTEILGVVGTSTGVSVSFAPYTAIGMTEWSIEGEAAAISEFGTNYVHIDLLASGEAVLTGTCGDATIEIPITVAEPTALEPGFSYGDGLEIGETTYYTFTAETEGTYFIYVPTIRDENGTGHTARVSIPVSNGHWDSLHTSYQNDGRYYYYNLAAGTTMTFEVRNNSEIALPGPDLRFDEAPAVESLSLSRELTGMVGESLYTEITAEPEAALVDLSFAIADESIARIETEWSDSLSIELLAQGETTLTVTNRFGGTWEFPITVEALPELTLDETLPVSLEAGAYSMVTFTAPAEGLYHLFTPYVEIDGSNYSYDLGYYTYQGEGTDVLGEPMDGGRYTIFYLKEGTQLTVKVQNYHSIDLDGSVVMTVAPDMESFYLSNRSMTMLVGDTQRNFAWGSPSGAWSVISWSVADPAIAEIVESETNCRFVVLRAKAIGETTLTATIESGFTVTCPVSVVDPTTVYLNDAHSFTVQMSKAAFFHCTAPADGVYAVKTPVLSTESGEYACDLGCNTYTGGELEQIGSQRTDLYNYCYYRMTEGTTVTLVASNPAPSALDTSITVENAQEATGIALVPGAVEGKENSYFTFRLKTLPEGAYAQGYAEYTVDDTSVAYTNWYNNYQGQLYLAKEGTATLTATWGGFTATATITVTGDTKLALNETYQTSLDAWCDERLLFTAPADGLYTFFVPMYYIPETGNPYTCNMWDNGIADGIGSYEMLRDLYAPNGRYMTYRLTAGTTLRLTLRNDLPVSTATSVTVTETPTPTELFFDTWSESGTAGDLLEFTVSYSPTEAYGQISFSLLGDPEVAVIEDQGNGRCDVRLLKAGTVTLTATCGEASVSQTITVTEPKYLTVGQPLELYLNWQTSEKLRFVFPETGMYMFSATGNGQGFEFYDGPYTGDGYIRGGGAWVDNTYHMFIGGNQGDTVDLWLDSYMSSSYTLTAVKTTAPESLTFTNAVITATTGSYAYAPLSMTPANAWGEVTYTVADPDIVTTFMPDACGVNLECLKAGTTTLTATCGDLSATVTVTVKDPVKLTAGEPMTLELPAGTRETIRFTYPDSGMYVFRATGSQSGFAFWDDYWTGDGDYNWGGSVWTNAGTQYTMYIGLEQNCTVTLILENNAETAATFTVSALKATEPTGLEPDCEEIVDVPGSYYEIGVGFLPDSGFGQVSWEIADETVARLDSAGNTHATIFMVALGETTLTATCGDASVTIPITVKAPLSFQLDQTTDVTVAPNVATRVLFTAPEDGIYAFRIPYMYVEEGEYSYSYSLNMNLSGWSGGTATMLTNRGGEDCNTYFVEMTKGTQAIFYLNNWSPVDIHTTVETVLAKAPTSLGFQAKEIRGVPGVGNGISVVMGPDTAWGTLTWSVEDESVAEITYSGETHCEFELLKVGQTTLTVSCGEVSASIPVIVEPPAELKLNETLDVTLDMDNYRTYFSFTAPTTGIYCFKTPVCTVTHPQHGTVQNSCSVSMYNESEQAHMLDEYTTDDFGLYFARIEGGTTVLLGMSWMMFGSVDTYVTAIEASEPESMTMSQHSLTLLHSEESGMHLYALLNPVGAYGQIEWTIEGDAAGIGYSYGNTAFIYTKQLGTATVTATCGDLSASCTVNVVDKMPVVVPGYGSGYDSLSDALADAEGYLALTGDVYEDLTVSKDSYLDLCGHVIEGDVTIEEGATLYVFDSATADYTADNCGAIIGTVTGNLARSFNTPAAYGHNYKYLALEVQENVWTFHRYYLSVKSVILAPCMEGEGYTGTAVNYKTVFKCSDLVAEYVTAYGAKLSGDNTVYTDYLAAGFSLKAGADNARTTRLEGTLKTTNSATQNAANALLAPTAQAYITLSDGTELCSAAVTRSLQDMAEYANTQQDLTHKQKQALGNMYHLFKASMDAWTGVDIGNIKAYAAEYFGTETAPAFAIIAQPESVTAGLNSNAVFCVVATGEGLTYQWQFSDGYAWSNTTTSGYSTPALTVEARDYRNGYQYRCVITDAKGNKLTSEPATLTIG